MTAEWANIQLGDVASVRSGFAFKSGDMGGLGLPIIKIKNVVPPTVDIRDCERVPEEVITNIPGIERFELKEGDILIAMTGATVGKVGRFPHSHERFFLNQRVGKVYLTEPNAADYRYIYYILSQDTYVRQMFGIADGSAQANISGSQIESLKVPLPPIKQQQAIAHILGTLDDKIELNRRMNKTLESIARAIFKSWFIDFEPIPGMGPHKEWEESVLGKIPKGWCWTVLGNVAGINRLSISRDLQGVIEYVDISSVSVGKLNGTTQYPVESAPSRAKRLVTHGDTLWSCVRPNRKSYLFVYRPPENMLVSTGFAVLSPEKIPSSYLHLWVTQEQFVDYLTSNADGSAYPAVRPEHFERAEFLLPTAQAVKEFHRIVELMIDKIFVNDRESVILSSIRDALFPKLLSGEIRIKDAEKIVSQAV